MDFLTCEELSIDDIGEALNCVRVRWHRGIRNDQFLPGKDYGLVLVDSIRGVLDVVPTGKWWRKLSCSSERRSELIPLGGDATECDGGVFYVIRFAKPKENEYFENHD